jgi:hypothetical protein
MPITEEERSILLERLEKARIAKAKKKEQTMKAVPAVAAPAATPAPVVPEQPTQPATPAPPKLPESAPAKKAAARKKPAIPVVATPIPDPPVEEPAEEPVEEEEADEDETEQEREIIQKYTEKPKPAKPAKPAKPVVSKKEKFSKIVFYKEPSRSKLKKIMNTLHESSDESSGSESEGEAVAPEPQNVVYRQPHRVNPVPPGFRHLPQFRAPEVNKQRQEYLRKLALEYF